MLGDVVHVLIATAGAVGEDGAGAHLAGFAHGKGDGVGAFEGRDDTLVTGELEEGIHTDSYLTRPMSRR